ncbi:MAG: adenylate/guanylate cyclase domain-containing protein [Saprospiraceae bacterium]
MRALSFFESGSEITTDKTLRQQNLQSLLGLAEELGRNQLAAKARDALAVLNGTATQEEKRGLFARRNEGLRPPAERADIPMPQRGEGETQRKQMAQQLAAKEALLQQMNEAQIKQELLLMEQNRLLDSFYYQTLFDSLQIATQNASITQQEMQIQQQANELALFNARRKLWMAVGGLLLIIGGGWYHRHRSILEHNKLLSEKNEMILTEKQRSDMLLLNILPLAVANELKQQGVAAARHYDTATVLFTDFKGFSRIAQTLSPQDLVATLDYAFRAFDEIIAKYGVEKIKTIGDAYMCAGGLPDKASASPLQVVEAALEMQLFLKEWNHSRAQQQLPLFEARIGIHSGPLVAGVVGSKKFAYDIWGDTVNVAARMESSGEAGTVNISQTTYEQVKAAFTCESRGLVEVKNLGKMEMYFVQDKIRESLSA